MLRKILVSKFLDIFNPSMEHVPLPIKLKGEEHRS